MKTRILILLCSILFSHLGKSQRLDFGGECTVPFFSTSIVSTKYDFLTDDPVSFHFAKIKRHTQIRPGFIMSVGVFSEISYRMFSVKVIASPIYTPHAIYKVYFPEIDGGETPYKSSTSSFGFHGQVNVKYSFNTFQNKKISLVAGGFYFRSYGTIDESESSSNKSDISPNDLYKYMLWDDRNYFYGVSFGLEFSWLNKYRKNRRLTILYNHVLTKYGYGGFNQGSLTCQIGFANLKIFGTLKRNKIFIHQ